MITPLKLERLTKGLTQFDLCQITGISQSRISYLERDKIAPSLWEMETLAKALDCEVEEIFPNVDKE